MLRRWRRCAPRWACEEIRNVIPLEARKLISFLGLECEPTCLDFHKTAWTVKTASLWQVRQRLYNSAVGRWRNYRQHIVPCAI
jgi:hypothetical protein